MRRSLAFNILIVCSVFDFRLGVLLYDFWYRFKCYLRSISRGLRLCRRRFNHMERAVFVFLLSFYIVRDFLVNRRGSVFKSTGVSYFGIPSIRFQAIKMYLLPLFLFSSLANHIGDLTRSAKNLERTVPRQIKLSGLRLVRFEQPNKVSFFKRFAMYFSNKILSLSSLIGSHSLLRLSMDFV